eukprot:TRINITY_DN64081_c1_g1_i1.p1 TRINITY_DN64081_c1_g1~~TRINITY_DN64081_c1_g1_i1.p1  ORF type:complete len:712 (-),score=102.79 TRINITY_DN64081_c1_g1_i1:71-2089(-)
MARASMLHLARLGALLPVVTTEASLDAGPVYARTDPAAFDAKLAAENTVEEHRSAGQCFCSESRNAKLWARLYEDLYAGLAANPKFDGPWVHAYCGFAYPIIFNTVSVDPRDDSFVMHADCPAAIIAMVIVCAQSSALQASEAASGGGAGGALSSQWRQHERIVRLEGGSVGDVFVAMTADECRRLCEQTPGCYSLAHGPGGCHLKDRCVSSEDPLVPEDHVQTEGMYTHYLEPCQRVAKAASSDAGGAAAPLQRPAHEEQEADDERAEQVQNMMLFAVRALEFAFHCLDESPWPFSLAEILENYALMTLAPRSFRWLRLDRVDLTARSKLDETSYVQDALPTLQPPAHANHSSWMPSRTRISRVRYVVRWYRGIESEVSFWRKKLSPDPSFNDNTERLEKWLGTGEVTWTYDDPCDFLSESIGRLQLAAQQQSTAVAGPKIGHVGFRFLNSGSGPFAAPPSRCLLRRSLLSEAAVSRAVRGGKCTEASADEVRCTVPVTSTDGLARFYSSLYDEHGISPLHVPQQCPVEELHRCFPPDHFDIVHMRNSLDHAFDPMLGIERLLHVTKPGGWVLLRHARNEGVPGQFRVGLHQWAFDTTPGAAHEPGGDTHFLIWNPELRVDVTRHLLETGLAAEVRTELKDHPSPDAPEDERFVWVDIRKPTQAERLRFTV